MIMKEQNNTIIQHLNQNNMEKQKSVVEFFKKNLEDGHLDISNRYWNELLTEGKLIEKERMIQFCTEYATSLMSGDGLTPTEFYNQTFKSE